MWAYDFVDCRTEDGRAVRMLTVIDEYTRECLAIRTARRIRSDEVIQTPISNCLSSTGLQNIFVQIMVRSLPPGWSVGGWSESG